MNRSMFGFGFVYMFGDAFVFVCGFLGFVFLVLIRCLSWIWCLLILVAFLAVGRLWLLRLVVGCVGVVFAVGVCGCCL